MAEPDYQSAAAAQLDAAYQAGDFAAVRLRARALLADATSDPADRALACSWLSRLTVDRSTLLVLGFAALLFCAIVARYVVH
jgi:hypothetical protein